MKHNRIYLLWMALTVLTLYTGQIRAQVTIGSNAAPDANALLDLKNQSNVNASTKGLLLPRVQLKATDNFAPLSAHVMGMVVYNTATAGIAPNDVTPGYYYNNGSKWIRLADAASPINLYTADGTLTDNRTVSQADKTLAFTSSATTGTSHFTVDGTTFNVDAVNNRVGIGTATPATKLDIQTGGTSTNPISGFKLTDGTQAAGKVLISDANGVGTWQYNKGLWQAGMFDGKTTAATGTIITFPYDAFYEIGEGHGTFDPVNGKMVLPFTGRYRVYSEAEYVSLSPVNGGVGTIVAVYDGITNTVKKTGGNTIAGRTIYPTAVASLVFEANAGDYITFSVSGGSFHECYLFVQLIDRP